MKNVLSISFISLVFGFITIQSWCGAEQVKENMHFHYWRPDGIERVTSAHMSPKGGSHQVSQEISEWQQLGVVPQRWRGGIWAYRKGYDTPETLAEYWVKPVEDGWPGILIDEITQEGNLREVAGKALIKAREMAPDLMIAVYVVPGITDHDFIEGLRSAADLVLIESYLGSARTEYRWIETRYQSAIENGLEDKSVLVLGLGGKWITTQRELCRQLHFIRYYFPEMPGIAFFGSTNPAMVKWLNAELKLFYENPVLLVELVDDKQAIVRNIGRSTAKSAQIMFAIDGRNQTIENRSYEITLIEPGDEYTLNLNGKNNKGISYYGSDYLVLAKPEIWEDEPFSLRASLSEPDLSSGPDWSWKQLSVVYEDDSLKRNKKGYIESVSMPVPAVLANSKFAFRTTFQLDRSDRYAHVRLILEQKGSDVSNTLTLYRTAKEPGAMWDWKSKTASGDWVHEALPFYIPVGEQMTLTMVYDPERGMRFTLSNADSDHIYWDTGDVEVPSEIYFDQLRLQVRADTEKSNIEFLRDGSVRLVGAAKNEESELLLQRIEFGVPLAK
ncbi:hypothetical protein QEH59_00125 [Coraliomargarita sp. SDUM461004]|uniref:Uncharacterized protein n=1 Tax=Thalassobacterium sedimentorum TaxID=3041258 RepID=A0ABU1ADU5_9BACT|nr:hypothetical protein [Coraliomargarita sp. SDUM461004]MDQ8192808.1 hypothetical protein [Coraliomargarita sp. SDUM461004]